MNPKKFALSVLMEAAVMITAAFVASYLIGQAPKQREWMKKQWDGVPGGLG